MTSSDYVAGALRTECDYDVVRERLRTNPGLVRKIFQALECGTQVGEFQTDVKRGLIGGKGKALSDVKDLGYDSLPGNLRDGLAVLLNNPQALRLLHAHLGRLSEAAESQEHLLEVLGGAEVKTTYLEAELGDGQWFSAIEANALGLTLEEVHQSNNAKLRARYPEKFTEERMSDRNLVLETAALWESRGLTGLI